MPRAQTDVKQKGVAVLYPQGLRILKFFLSPSLDSVPLFNSTKNQRVKFAFRTAPQFPVPSYDYMKMFASARRLVFDGEDGQIKRPSLQDLKLPYMDEPCVSSSVRLSPNWYTDLYVGVERILSRDRIRADLKTYNLEGNSASIHLIGLSGEAWVVGRLLGSVAACLPRLGWGCERGKCTVL